MDKLELKDIAPYIGYELNFYCEDTESGEYEILGVSKIDLSMELFEIGSCDYTWDNIGNDSKGVICKPILRPMSDLTKEITHNGETFVPMEKLAQIAFERLDTFHIHSDIEIITAYKTDENEAYRTLKYNADNKSFVVSVLDENLFRIRNLATKNQYDLFQKLCEWHIDFQDLIGRGLAINLNEVDNGK
ncbi:hypothetical protein CMU04_06470 [Elizabethkingia anophelis]|nr:hypothetical protein [Elizabethkingia anophelis]